MKNLDALLYQWIGEVNELRAEDAFRAYYSVAFPSLVRHVQCRTGWDFASAEDIAQEALLRFFERTGRGRREAMLAVVTGAVRLAALRLDELQARRIAGWVHEIKAFVASVTKLPSARNAVGADWRAITGSLPAQIAYLQRQGLHLLYEARRTLQRLERGPAVEETEWVRPQSLETEAGMTDLDAGGISGLAHDLARELSVAGARAAAKERWSDAEEFARTALGLIEMLPRLRVPTNGYLFEIATTTMLDEMKRRRRKKRGGVVSRAAEHHADACCAPEMAGHPLDAAPDGPQEDLGAAPELEWDQGSGRHSFPGAESAAISVDPVIRYESEDLLQSFYEYLRVPVMRAARDLEQARSCGRGLAEQRRLESVSRKFSRTMLVLSMMGEGYTQEEAGRSAELSRNQVKYIIERVKEAYERFMAGQPGNCRPRLDREGESHVS